MYVTCLSKVSTLQLKAQLRTTYILYKASQETKYASDIMKIQPTFMYTFSLVLNGNMSQPALLFCIISLSLQSVENFFFHVLYPFFLLVTTEFIHIYGNYFFWAESLMQSKVVSAQIVMEFHVVLGIQTQIKLHNHIRQFG